MKKNLLIFTLIMPFMAFSQTTPNAKKFGNLSAGGAEKISFNRMATDQTPDSSAKQKGTTSTPAGNGAKRGIVSYNFVKVGSTYYDLQTNASIGRRVLLYPDGKVSVVWTTSTDDVYNLRGTGYNHYDGTNWLTVANPTPRLENVRLGWPSIGVNGTKEWVMGHDAINGGFVMSTNASIGSTSWTSNSPVLTQNNRRPIWGRIMNNGNFFHCIASYSDSTLPGDPRAPKINGVFAPMTYSRSTNGGTVWDIEHSLLPGYDDSRMSSGGGDQYAMDVRDSIVAIITGDLLEDVVVWKSTNNGLTFTKMIIDSFKYAPHNSKKLMLDTPFVADGSMSVLIDPMGKVHAFWGASRVMDDDTTDESYSFFPGTALLAYWSERSNGVSFIAGGGQFDRNKNNTLDISRGNTSILENGQVPTSLKTAGISSVARLGNTSLLHMPSAGMDDKGNIFVTFSFPLEQDVDVNNVNLRDVMIVHSTDTGKTWAEPQDITQMQGTEEEFASISRTVDNFVHVIFQRDVTAGTNLQNNSASDNNHPATVNEILYAAVPVSKILDGSIQTLWNVGIEQFDANKEVFVVSQNFPNPFSNTSEVIIWLNTTSDVNIDIMDVSGQVISTQNYSDLGAGNHALTMNADGLASGIYLYTVRTATHSVTRKMMINN
jgi:hypothetical protein